MPRACLTVTPTDDAWLAAVSRAHPSTTFRVRSALPDCGSGGVDLLEVEGGTDLPAVVGAIDAAPEVTDLTVLARDVDRLVVGVETSNGRLLSLVQNTGVTPSFPFTVVDGRVHWEFLADSDRFAALAAQLDAAGAEYTVDSVEQPSSEGALTPTQRRLVWTAVERGYYETPRNYELRDLAAECDIALSTCSETLRRAEGEILRRYVGLGTPSGGAT